MRNLDTDKFQIHKEQNMIRACLFAFSILAAAFAQTASAQSAKSASRTVEEPGRATDETKRVLTFDTNDTLLSMTIYYKDGDSREQNYRSDGTSESVRIFNKNGTVWGHIEYDALGKTILKSRSYNSSGGLQSEFIRKSSAHTILSRYSTNGKLYCEEETFRKYGYRKVWYRDGKQWYGVEYRPDLKAASLEFYFAPGGKYVARRGSYTDTMTVSVDDSKGNELYEQTWKNAKSGYELSSIKEPTANGGWRVISVRAGNILSASYYKADGSLIRTEPAASLTTPVDPSRLKELDPNDPNIPVQGEFELN